jgi:hypothetical protein
VKPGFSLRKAMAKKRADLPVIMIKINALNRWDNG